MVVEVEFVLEFVVLKSILFTLIFVLVLLLMVGVVFMFGLILESEGIEKEES